MQEPLPLFDCKVASQRSGGETGGFGQRVPAVQDDVAGTQWLPPGSMSLPDQELWPLESADRKAAQASFEAQIGSYCCN